MKTRILCGALLPLAACGTRTPAFQSPSLRLAEEPATGAAPGLSHAAWDDYRHGAGRLDDGTSKIHLRAQEVDWLPWGEDGPTLQTYSFSADGGAPRVPAPMIRVFAGTPVEATVTNGLDRTLVLRGLNDRAEPR